MPSARVWVKQGLDSHRSVQVLLVPLGNIAPDVYAKYSEILRRFSTIPMQNLTAPGDWKKQNGALKHFNWSEGCFNFHFIDQDTTDGGPSEWEDYQAYRRVLGVIGVVHFPSCEDGRADFKELEKEFNAVVAGYKHAQATRIFAFGHSFEQGDYPDILDPQRDIVFPPEQEFEDGGSTTELHMAVSLYDVAVSIIKNLAADVNTWSSSTSASAAGRAVAALRGNSDSTPPLTSWYEREEVLSDSKITKRRVGRLHKWIGDTCLLLGSPKDALEHYSQSMSETKASSDPLWHAGCLEGYAACLSAMSDADHPTVHGDQALALLRDMAKDKDLEKAGQEGSSTWTVLAEAVVSEKCEEALAVFSRYPPLGSLEVELCFKTARFHACAQPNPRWDEALVALLRALTVPDMPLQVQLERSIEAAVLCEGMGLKRKAALFAHLSAMLCSDSEAWTTAHLLARMAGEGYGALLPPTPPTSSYLLRSGTARTCPGARTPPLTSSTVAPLDGRGEGRGGEGGGGEGWLVLRKNLLQWLLAVSARCGDVRASSEYFAGLTELMAALEEERSNADRFMVSLPPLPSEGMSPGGAVPPQVPLVIEALGNVSATPSLNLAPPASARESRVSWSDRMMRRAVVEAPLTVSAQAQQTFLPSTPSTSMASFASGSGITAGSSSRDAFLGSHSRSPPTPASPMQQRLENLASDFLQPASSSSTTAAAAAATAAAVKKSRKISLPKSIGRKINASRSGSSSKEPPLLSSEAGGGGNSGSASVGGGGTGGGRACAVAHRAASTLEEQWETLSDMAQCTSRLALEDAARVRLSGIPRLESARLLHFDGSLALLPGDGAATASLSSDSKATAPSSSLFYNPFEDAGMDDGSLDDGGSWEDGDMDESDGEEGRQGDRGAAEKGGGYGGGGGGGGGGPGADIPARWAAGDTGRIVARFSNPLQVPLEVESITAVVDGARVRAFPTSVVLPAKAEYHEVDLYVKPLEDGQVVLRGVSVEVLSIVTMCKVDKWGRGISHGPRAPAPRTYKSLRATFRRPRHVLTTDTVDIAADAAAAAAIAEAAAAAVQAEEEGGLVDKEEGDFGEAGGDGFGVNGVEVIGTAGGAELAQGASEGTTGNDASGGNGEGAGDGRDDKANNKNGSKPPAEADESNLRAQDGGQMQHQEKARTGEEQNGGEKESEKANEEEEEEEEEEEADEEEEFSPDPRMRKGETACRKMRVERAAPTVRVSRSSPSTSEALAGEEVEEILQLVNHGEPSVGVMEVWTRPCRSVGNSASKPSPAMSLLFSLAEVIEVSSVSTSDGTSAGTGAATTAIAAVGNGGVSAMSCPGLDVSLAAPMKVSGCVTEGLIHGDEIMLPLRLSAGRSVDRDVVTEVLVKYSEKEGAAFHRQLRIPIRLGIRGGLRVCSLRVAQFLDGGLSFEDDADATECLLLVELANDSPFSLFSWRSRNRRPVPDAAAAGTPVGDAKHAASSFEGRGWSEAVGAEVEADAGLRSGEVMEFPGDSRRCVYLRIPRLSVRPEGKSAEPDEPRSPLSLRSLFEWEKSLAKHLHEELSLRWSTTRDEAVAAAAAVAAASGPPATGVLSAARAKEGEGGGAVRVMANEVGAFGWKSGRRGRVRFALDRIGDDGSCRDLGEEAGGIGGAGPTGRPPRHPEAVPECLLGALLPPVRLSCVPFASAGSCAKSGAGCLFGAEGYPTVGINDAGEIEVDGGADGVEGGWTAKATVDSFLPVSLVVQNSSAWPIDVVVEVTSIAEGQEEEGPRSWGDDDEDNSGPVMWSGMPRRCLGKLSPGQSACHGLLACFLAPGDVSIGFTCRVKIESPSAPYGSATQSPGASSSPAAAAAAAAAASDTIGQGVSKPGDGWHPVACHLPLRVSVSTKGQNAAGAGVDGKKAQVQRVRARIGSTPAGEG